MANFAVAAAVAGASTAAAPYVLKPGETGAVILAPSSADAYVQSTGTRAQVESGSGGSLSVTDSASYNVLFSQPSSFVNRETFIPFDAASLPPTASVTAAGLTLLLATINSGLVTTHVVYDHDFGSGVITTADYLPKATLAAKTALASVALNSATDIAPKSVEFHLTAPTLTSDGFVRLVLADGRFVSGGTPTATNLAALYDSATGTTPPRLIVYYATGADYAVSASLTGAGTVVGDGTLDGPEDYAIASGLTGAGAVAGAAVAAHPVAADLGGAATVAGDATFPLPEDYAVASSLSGAGVAAGSVTATRIMASALAGAGATAAAVALARPVAADVAASGTLAAAVDRRSSVAASLAGVGTPTADAVRLTDLSVAAALAAAATITAIIPSAYVDAALVGSSALRSTLSYGRGFFSVGDWWTNMGAYWLTGKPFAQAAPAHSATFSSEASGRYWDSWLVIQTGCDLVTFSGIDSGGASITGSYVPVENVAYTPAAPLRGVSLSLSWNAGTGETLSGVTFYQDPYVTLAGGLTLTPLGGAGNLSANAVRVAAVAAALLGAGATGATITAALLAAAGLVGAGSVDAPITMQAFSAVDLVGAGALEAPVTLAVAIAAVLIGEALVTTDWAMAYEVAVELFGSAAVAGAVERAIFLHAALRGGGATRELVADYLQRAGMKPYGWSVEDGTAWSTRWLRQRGLA